MYVHVGLCPACHNILDSAINVLVTLYETPNWQYYVKLSSYTCLQSALPNEIAKNQELAYTIYFYGSIMYACVNYLSHKANMQKFIELKKYKFPAFLSVTQKRRHENQFGTSAV